MNARAQTTPATWTTEAVLALYALPFNDLVHRAACVHRQHFDPNAVQLSTLLSVKTGGCSEDCGYCAQSARYDTGLTRQGLLEVEQVVEAARAAQAQGATRFCMGAAWRGPKDRDLAVVIDMVRAVKALGLETCVTLGQLRPGQAERLKAAGLDYYNHNLDTGSDYYDRVVSTHSYEDRLRTLNQVRAAGIKVCCGGIIGMGEDRRVRAQLIAELASLDPPPESVPINLLVKIPGTPMAQVEDLDPLELVRTIACARITMPRSYVRLSAGRRALGEAVQALCFLAGANSVFYGDRLLTTDNAEVEADQRLFAKLGIRPEPVQGRRCAGAD
ncbi:MAG: biotin synthase BioB [Thiobacillaceae bacterium]|nr:biotin synthase BioB [Thiobacillaceae bacterium]MCX7672958.1 biotin synthase BioB [Thiobacillaceae bacterium]MDW8324348.1 biotin synthase BioB [Burkholderiales bacterium]